MTVESAERNPIDELAEEFAARFRRGERPALSEYIQKYPDLADEIREVFPALIMMEQLKPVAADLAPSASGEGRPERIGDYRILREIGRGGMGVVYEAEQVSLGRHVALKVLPLAGLSNPIYLERFRREAKAAAQLHHTNIVPVFGVGESDGVHYYTMQFIHGEGLDKVLHDLRRLRQRQGSAPEDQGAANASPGSVAHSLLTGQLAGLEVEEAAQPAVPGSDPPVAEASSGNLSGGQLAPAYCRGVARVVLQVAEALAYAHKQGILHRDVKPSNLILDLQGTVWITDFGLAKADGADDLTHTGDIVGTLRYMAPERFDGASLPQGDVYAVGMTLYKLLTLRPAFDDDNRGRLVQRVLHEDPPRPRKLNPRIPRDLETIVLKASARDPASRYATAEALAEDLRRFLTDRPLRARRTSAAEHLGRWFRRNPAVASLIGVIALLLIVVAVGSTLTALSLNASKKDALDKLWRSKLNEARTTVLTRLPGQRFTSLERIREALALAEQLGLTGEDRLQLRNAAIAVLILPDFELVREWDGWPVGTTSFGFDARLERYARADQDGRVSIRRIGDDQEVLALPGMGKPANLRLSRDGRHLVLCSGTDRNTGTLQVWRLDPPQPRCLHEGTSWSFLFTDFSADGQTLVYVAPEQLRVLDLETGRSHAWPLPATHSVQGVKCRPAGGQVAIRGTANGKGLVEIRDLATGAVQAQLWHEQPCSSHAWHPGGRFLAVACEEGSNAIHLWDVGTRQRLTVLEGHKTNGISVRFSSAGDRLISSNYGGMMRLWDVASGRQLHGIPGIAEYAVFSSDDRYLACANSSAGSYHRLRLFRFAAGREVRTLVHRPPGRMGLYQGAVFSTDGQLAALATINTRPPESTGIVLLAWPSGQEKARLPVGGVYPLCFDSSGALWTLSLSGDVLRWPRSTDLAAKTIRFGPPKPMISVPGTEAKALSPDGRILVLANFSQGSLILHRGPMDRLIPTGVQEDVRYGAVSPDGRWVASGSHWCNKGVGAKVWDAQTGRLVQDFAVGSLCLVGFSADGRWFVTGGGGTRLWRTGTWAEGPRVLVEGDGNGWAFSPDGRLLALGGQGRVRLVWPDTGAEVARLTWTDQATFVPVSFTADGGELLVQGEDTEALHVWDLRLIRRQLAELGLDWEDPPLADPLAPAGPREDGSARTVEFLGADSVSDPRNPRP